MNKRLVIVIAILVALAFTYYQLITNHEQELDSMDRSVLLYNYNQKNYVGTFSSAEHHINVIELDDRLTIDGNKVIGDFDSSTGLVKYLKSALNYDVEDVFEFNDDNKLISNNISEKNKEFYGEIIEYREDINDILINGNIKKYHPKYNNVLARIGNSVKVDVDGESKSLVADGVITKGVVKEMIEADITEQDINNAFVTIITPALECETETCIVIEPYYNEIRKEFNKDTNHDLPEYSELTKKEE